MTLQEIRTPDAPPPDVRRVRRVLIGILVVGVVGAIVSIAVLSRGDAGSLAQLRIRDDHVDVRSGSRGFKGAIEGQRLAVGDSVRTNSAGQAQVDYFDGSLTRLDVNTIFVIRELADAPKARRIALDLDSGRTWNRVKQLTSPQDRYEVRAGNAVATVRGTTFLTDCRKAPICYYLAVQDVINVTSSSGESKDLNPNDCVKTTEDAGLDKCTPEEIKWLLDGWANEQIYMDGLQAAQEQAQATATPTAAPPEAGGGGGGGGKKRSAPTGAVTTPSGHGVPDWLNAPSDATPRTHDPSTPRPPIATEPPATEPASTPPPITDPPPPTD